MPTYGYRCSRGHHWEIVQRITEAPLTQCPECGAPATRVFYPVGIVFKGQGFYKTDSRGSGGIPAGNVSDGASKDGKSGDKDGKSSGETTKTETAAKTSTESSSTKSDAAATPPPAKTEEK